MFGAVFKKFFTKKMNIPAEDMFVVSVMPCTAKKFEATRPEMSTDGYQDIDAVITTVELARMIRKMGIKFEELEPASLDMPFGFSSGAGVLFGTSGGVAEAALRYATEKLTGETLQEVNFKEVRGLQGLKEANFTIAGKEIKLAVVSGLANTQKVIDKIRNKEVNYDFVEVMACPGGCIGGGGQPVPNTTDARIKRSKGLYDIDAKATVKKSQNNPTIEKLYDEWLKTPNSDEAHYALHTHYGHKKRIGGMEIKDDDKDASTEKIVISVCVGTNCYLKGSYDVLQSLIGLAQEHGVEDKVEFKGTFCLENCSNGPSIKVSDDLHKYGIQKDEVQKFFTNVILPRVK
jgi:NADH-quinone oxidoreductase subunit G